MNVSVLIATYGDAHWRRMAQQRAYPSAFGQSAHEILLHHAPDATIAQTRNQVGEQATGEWLCFLDADDELGPGYLDAMRAAHQREPAGEQILLTPAVTYVRGQRRSVPRHLDRGIPLTDDNWLVVGTLIRRDLFLQVGGFSDYPHGFEDWSLWAKAWRAGARVIKVHGAVYVAYWNRESKHRQGWRDRAWQVETHQRVRRELFPEL